MIDDSYKYSINLIESMQKTVCFKCKVKDKLDKNLILITDWLYHRSQLNNSECELIVFRYARLIKRIRSLYLSYTFFHTVACLFTSIAALLVTALISLNKFTSENYSELSWWLSWMLALLISIVNTLATFFKWDRKYLLLLQIYNKIEQEVWMFIGLIGPYASFDDEEAASHKSKLRIFLARIELANKRLNDNLLDIEENDQDDRELLRRKHCKNKDNNGIDNFLKTEHGQIQQNELNADLQIIEKKVSNDLPANDLPANDLPTNDLPANDSKQSNELQDDPDIIN